VLKDEGSSLIVITLELAEISPPPEFYTGSGFL